MEKYESPVMEVIRFENEDVIICSCPNVTPDTSVDGNNC